MATHKFGNHLDQLFAKNIDITNAVVNQDLDHDITDHKCIKVCLKFRKDLNRSANIQQHNVNFIPGDHSTLKQGTIRKLVNEEATTKKMLESERVLDSPAFQYIDPSAIDEEVEIELQQAANRERVKRQPVKYKSRAQSQFEEQELAITAEFNEVRDI